MLSKLLLMVLTCHAIFTCISQVEESKDNHFMYWVNRGYKGVLGAFKPPTKNLHSIKFPEWLKIAHTADEVCVLSFPFLLLFAAFRGVISVCHTFLYLFSTWSSGDLQA